MAAISASELNVILQARDKEFTKAMDRAQRRVERFAKQSGKGLSNTTKTFNVLGSAASKLGLAFSAGAVMAGFTALIDNASRSAKELTNLSRVAGVGVEDFQKMAFASKTVGIEQDKLADILKDVNDKFGDYFATGAGPLADFFENIAPKVGVTAKAFQGLSSDQALGLYVKTLQEAGVNQQELTFYMEAIASDATALAPLLLNNAEAMTELGARAEALGIVLDEDLIGKSAKLRERWDEVMGAMSGRLTEFALYALQVFDRIFNLTEEEQLKELARQLQDSVEAYDEQEKIIKSMNEGSYGDLINNEEARAAAIENATKALEKNADAIRENEANYKSFVKQIEERDALRDFLENGLPPGQGSGSGSGQGSGFKGMGEDIKGATQELKIMASAMDDLDKISGTLEQGLEDVFMSALDGAKSFEDQVKLTMQAVIRELYRVLVVQQLVNAAMGIFGVGSPTGGGGGGRASGGPVQPGQPYTVGEHGREIFVPSSAGRILSVPQSKDAISGGGDVVINQTINVTTGVQQTVRAEIKSLMPQIAESAKGAVADAKMRGGQYKRAFS
jgi:hypothetical protein